MGAYQRGTSINLVNRFWAVDPLTQLGVLADPTTVVFTVLDPDGDETIYTFGVDVNVTHPATGIYICKLTPPLPTGTYRYLCVGTGAVVASSEDMFDIEASGVLTPSAPTVAVPGPCSPWINGDDVAAGGNDLGVGDDHFLLDDVAYAASSLLYDLSGRQFPGVCTRTIRPCADKCSCWGFSPSLGLGPWAWVSSAAWGGAGVGPWYWRNECGDTCGCGYLSEVELSGYPVQQILEVKINGTVLPLLDSNNNPNYRLDNRRTLVRMNDPGPPPNPRAWPACQDMSLDDTQDSTFAITYTWGTDVPWIGRQAAAQLARELYKASNNQTCQLPTKVTKIVRQGITMERVVPMADMLRGGATGLQLVDAFIAQYNPTKMRRRPAVWSPDWPRRGRKVGQS